jgi:hypothetical protein
MKSEIYSWAIFIGPVVLAALFVIMLGRLRSRKESRVDLSKYSLKDSVLSLAELRFYKVLSEVVGTKYQILVNPRLEDLFGVANGKGFEAAQNRLAGKQLDYLFCDPVTFEPVLGIDLVEQAPQSRNGTARDKFEDSLYTNTGLKILHVQAARAYKAEDLRDKIIAVFRENGG